MLDASAFYAGIPFASPRTYHTTPEVHDEIGHIGAGHGAVDALIAMGRLVITTPSEASLRRIRQVAREAGEGSELSDADLSVIALCAELAGRLITDDYAVSNVAKRAGLRVMPVMTGGTGRPRRWTRYCPACGRAAGTEDVCGVCGSAVRRRPARRR